MSAAERLKRRRPARVTVALERAMETFLESYPAFRDWWEQRNGAIGATGRPLPVDAMEDAIEAYQEAIDA